MAVSVAMAVDCALRLRTFAQKFLTKYKNFWFFRKSARNKNFGSLEKQKLQNQNFRVGKFLFSVFF